MMKLNKTLRLWDVVALCLGAMFSSGFFLLPGLAYAYTGPSVFLAYIGAGFLILPSMLSQAELCTAMPKSGGVYFFLDRAFGPVIGTIGGLGAYFGLVLKTAFALVGFGAYLQFYTTVPSSVIALVLALLFVLLNIAGAKESGSLQKIMVGFLCLAMLVFLGEGLRTLALTPLDIIGDRFSGFFAGGLGQFFYSMAFVFVSYAGLTKVGSVAEEVVDPERNIPLGMGIALFLAMFIYGLGVFIVVGLVPGPELLNNLQPIATAESYAFSWFPGGGAFLLVIGAALMAFASTGNAGILASSRYPLAMARDHLLPGFLGRLNRFNVPGFGVVVTGVLMGIVIIFVSEEGIAKFASAFQLSLLIIN
ncbi:MAG: APC family permease [bacterium]|nr:APC family permease [bacterium]